MTTKTVRARQYETVDQIAARCYDGDTSMTCAIYDVNPGLADLGIKLPSGTLVILPEKQVTTSEPVSLWD